MTHCGHSRGKKKIESYVLEKLLDTEEYSQLFCYFVIGFHKRLSFTTSSTTSTDYLVPPTQPTTFSLFMYFCTGLDEKLSGRREEINFWTTMSKMRAAVVGAGISGLVSAYVLAQAGVDVVLYEKEDYLGGHAKTVTFDGVDLDLGFMVFNRVSCP